jgi:hypothetical protein
MWGLLTLVLLFARIYRHAELVTAPFYWRATLSWPHQITMSAGLHLKPDHPVALELKSLRHSVATFQVRQTQFYHTNGLTVEWFSL